MRASGKHASARPATTIAARPRERTTQAASPALIATTSTVRQRATAMASRVPRKRPTIAAGVIKSAIPGGWTNA